MDLHCRPHSGRSTRQTLHRTSPPGSADGRRRHSGGPCARASTAAGGIFTPAFPYDHFTKATDEDIRAIYAHLMTLEPVEFVPPDNELGFPFNVRMLLAGWKLLFLDKGEFRPDSQRGEEWNRGAYLAEGLGHCGACHTPRNMFGAVIRSAAYDGGEAEEWHAPALNETSRTPIPWNQLQLVNYLFDDGTRSTGLRPDRWLLW